MLPQVTKEYDDRIRRVPGASPESTGVSFLASLTQTSGADTATLSDTRRSGCTLELYESLGERRPVGCWLNSTLLDFVEAGTSERHPNVNSLHYPSGRCSTNTCG
jgi:hypothetical protein